MDIQTTLNSLSACQVVYSVGSGVSFRFAHTNTHDYDNNGETKLNPLWQGLQTTATATATAKRC